MFNYKLVVYIKDTIDTAATYHFYLKELRL